MIPPLMLDVKPEHRVLDLCAAPGRGLHSSTFQLNLSRF
jgi:multisite-specific tRNA:(cytosine-C5)-methyltransferase/tRNA (cytosine34-C5)-methyltransferase